jgi:hypothetical protein
MDDYEYKPISSSTELSREEPPINLPPSREVSGYTKASTSLSDLDIFENNLIEPPVEIPYTEYSETPVKTVIVTEEESKRYPKQNSERLTSLSQKKNTDRKTRYFSEKNFISNLATIYMEILDELMFVNSLDDLKDIFSKDNRLVALGILLIVLSVFLVFFNKV